MCDMRKKVVATLTSCIVFSNQQYPLGHPKNYNGCPAEQLEIAPVLSDLPTLTLMEFAWGKRWRGGQR